MPFDFNNLLQHPAIVGALVAACISVMLAVPTLWISLKTWRQNRLSYFSGRESRIEDLYDRLMDYRLKHPEVLKLSRRWERECLTKIYSQSNEDERAWAIYFGYVELCISYCNVTLFARKRSQLDPEVYRTQHEPLVKLLISEHFPIMQQLTQEGFASSIIAEFIVEMRKRGWEWEKQYEKMDKVL